MVLGSGLAIVDTGCQEIIGADLVNVNVLEIVPAANLEVSAA
jgi:hypothetical protein